MKLSGGFDGVQYLCVVEVYDSESNCWRKLAPLSTGRAGAAVVAVPAPRNLFWYNNYQLTTYITTPATAALFDLAGEYLLFDIGLSDSSDDDTMWG